MLGIGLSINNNEVGESGPTLPLDEITGAQLAFSASRKLRDAYSGSAIRIRRSSDDAEQDIGFSGNDIDESAITTFAGSNSAYVVTAYDQSGNSLDFTYPTAALQPRIVNAGTVDKVNGKVSMYFATLTRLELSGFTGGATTTIFAVTGGNSDLKILLRGQTGTYFCGMSNDTNAAASYQNVGTPTNYVNGSSIGTTRDNMHDALNNTQALTSITSLDFSSLTGLGTYFGGTPRYDSKEYFQELIIYDSDKSSDRTTIETNCNDYYGIY